MTLRCRIPKGAFTRENKSSASATCLAFLGLLFAFLFVPCAVLGQSTPESPIKVHGGSTTFFTQSPKSWVPIKGSTETYCTSLSNGDINQVHIGGFYNHTRDFTSKGARNGAVAVNAYDWRIVFLGHRPSELQQVEVSQQGIVMQASRLDCANQRTGQGSIRISPLQGAHFYSKDLLPTQLYHGNKRFRSSCTGEETDLCERTAQISVYPSSNLNDTKPATDTFVCPDGACSVFVGAIKDVPLAPTVRVAGDPGRPARR